MSHDRSTSRRELTPLPVLRALAALRRAQALYPPGHAVIDQNADELERAVRAVVDGYGRFRVEIIGGTAHIDGYPFRVESLANRELLTDLTRSGVDCLQIDPGVTRAELIATAGLLNDLRDGHLPGGELRDAYAARNVHHISLARLIPIAAEPTGLEDWPSLPTEIRDEGYAAILEEAGRSLGPVFDGDTPDAGAIRDLLAAVMDGIATGSGTLPAILSLKLYENHTYCHAVNVASLAMMLGKRLELPPDSLRMLVEGALLHDIGKRSIPVEILRKAGPLNQREWWIMERHPAFGAEILAAAGGFTPVTPTIALEHHRDCDGGGGYPDLGAARPHPMSQIVSVADTYEALTAARCYRDPLAPDEACLILARLAGSKLNPSLVRAFVSLVTFFPPGTIVRTTQGEVGVVVETSEKDPLHPVILTLSEDGSAVAEGERIDTAARNTAGEYLRHVLETLPPPRPAAAAGAEEASRRAAEERAKPLRPTRWETGDGAFRRARRPERPGRPDAPAVPGS